MWVVVCGALYELCLPFVSTGVCGKERGRYMEENGHVSRSLERYEEDFVVSLYILLSLPVIS